MAKKAKPANPNDIRFKCHRCGVGLRVSKDMAGRYMPCPKCKQRIPVPIDQAEADAEMKDLRVQDMAYDVPTNCMKCGKKLSKGSVICVNCGFDYREGKQIVPEDHTVRQGEKMRGKPALAFWIVESVILGGCIVVAIIYNLSGPFFAETGCPPFVEYGILISTTLIMLLLIPAHLVQWNNYRQVPDRESPTKLIEDRAERDEARSPYGTKTALLVVLCILIGFGIAFPVWGGEMFTDAKKMIGLGN